MIEGQGKDSCGKSGTDATQELKRRGGTSATPWKAKSCTEIHCGWKSG
ncbi:hypothetical protein P4652_04565 [Priestia megaterium]|nr:MULTISPECIES: hypothetical protein [Priestia]MBY0089608.1 hypothetical protein [Priestia aryabhattai]MBY0100803.1 hypothetical protein [Priestia aryabhattai]MCM3098255.1 hypothetical protein [Priestia megaterium]MCM3303946.1 hypothetical protein [Priestia megaterium]MED4137524.1 hypothetical protein [Priestia megaterium]